MGWIPLPTASQCAKVMWITSQEGGRIHERSYHRWVGFGKAGFSSHGATADGSVAFRKKLSCGQLPGTVRAPEVERRRVRRSEDSKDKRSVTTVLGTHQGQWATSPQN